MSKEKFSPRISRRTALRRVALVGSLAGLVLGGGLAFGQSRQGDLAILTAALYLEHEAIAAYQAGADSSLLSPELTEVAVALQGDHKYHRDGITGVIRTLGGEPIEAQSKYRFGRLRTADDILKLALRLEEGAVAAYSTLASNIENKDVLNFAAHVLADEVRHLTVLKNALGLPNY